MGLRSRFFTLELYSFAALIGLAAGSMAVAFRWAYDQVQYLSLGQAGDFLLTYLASQPAWRIAIVPALGGLLVGLLSRLFFGRRGAVPGVALVVKAYQEQGGKLNLGAALRTTLVNLIALGTGASVGREGPMVTLGAAVGNFFTRLFRAEPQLMRTYLACGVASGVAASFNAPLAGMFFALEVIMGAYRTAAFAQVLPIALASVCGVLVSHQIYGDEVAFTLIMQMGSGLAELPAFLVLGIVCGLLAGGFSRLTYEAQQAWLRRPRLVWLGPAIAGLCVSLLVLSGTPQVLGVGYETLTDLMAGTYATSFLIWLLVAKFLASLVCVAMGYGSGVFSPSLVLGGLAGAMVGRVALGLGPDALVQSSEPTYVLAGMGAVASVVLGAPLSTILMVFELTREYEVTLAVIAAVIAAQAVGNRFAPYSFFQLSLGQHLKPNAGASGSR